jgi:hypothetical protein
MSNDNLVGALSFLALPLARWLAFLTGRAEALEAMLMGGDLSWCTETTEVFPERLAEVLQQLGASPQRSKELAAAIMRSSSAPSPSERLHTKFVELRELAARLAPGLALLAGLKDEPKSDEITQQLLQPIQADDLRQFIRIIISYFLDWLEFSDLFAAAALAVWLRSMPTSALQGAAHLIAQPPAWLPQEAWLWAIGVTLQRIAQDEDPAPIVGLATDPRMRAVWSELGKRRRNGPGFVYPIPSILGDNEERRAQVTTLLLLIAALSLYNDTSRAISRGELDGMRQHWRRRALLLREIQAELAGFCTDISDPMLAGLVAAAEFCNQKAEAAASNSQLVVDRHRTDPRLRAFLVELIGITRRLFDRPLYGVVATIASVLFDCEVSPSLVRSITRTLCT